MMESPHLEDNRGKINYSPFPVVLLFSLSCWGNTEQLSVRRTNGGRCSQGLQQTLLTDIKLANCLMQTTYSSQRCMCSCGVCITLENGKSDFQFKYNILKVLIQCFFTALGQMIRKQTQWASCKNHSYEQICS